MAAQAGPPSASVFFPSAAPLPGCPFFSAPFLAWSLPLATSLHRFFTSLFLFRSRLCVAPLILGPSHVWPYRHGGHGHRVYFPPPSGTFRLLDTHTGRPRNDPSGKQKAKERRPQPSRHEVARGRGRAAKKKLTRRPPDRAESKKQAGWQKSRPRRDRTEKERAAKKGGQQEHKK